MAGSRLNPTHHIDAVVELYGEDYAIFPFFTEFTRVWSERLKQASTIKREPMNSCYQGGVYQETYVLTIDYPDKRVFQYEWDIAQATRELHALDHKPIPFSLKGILPFVDQEGLTFDDPKSQVPQHPPILLKVSLAGREAVVVNGNHRIMTQFRGGGKSLPVYVVPEAHHTKWLISEEMRLFYEWNSDMQRLTQLLDTLEQGQQIEVETIEHSLYFRKRRD